MDPNWLGQPVERVNGIGARTAERLHRLGLKRFWDVLCHLPLRYEDRVHARAINSVRPGERLLIAATVTDSRIRSSRQGGRYLEAHVEDPTGQLTLVFFHFSGFQTRHLTPGRAIRCFGEIAAYGERCSMIHPELEDADSGASPSDRLTPIYPSTAQLPQATLRRLTAHVLDGLTEQPADAALQRLLTEQPLPGATAAEWPGLIEAFRTVHYPPARCVGPAFEAGTSPWHRRLALDELLAHHLAWAHEPTPTKAPTLASTPPRAGLLADFLAGLPFELTGDQHRALETLVTDLSNPRPMRRLLQGDVGSGKTVVAAAACAAIVERGGQAAFMVPTELLAEQQFHSLQAWFQPLGVSVTRLTGRLEGATRRTTLDSLSAGTCPVVVGTHALFQESVAFHHLALVVVDEQHRFGVHQRLALHDKGRTGTREPHQLIMTATPIPRTLAMVAYTDLAQSVIRERPPGRRPVQTLAVPAARRERVEARLAEACRAGQQAYWVNPFIETPEDAPGPGAEDTVTRLRERLPGIRIGLLHGRLPAAEREQVMADFKNGTLDLLVATTVVEVGVDVPDATLMVIENAERFGLAQLHQLRGRIGRGTRQSYCVLLYHGALSPVAGDRIQALRETDDGFRIAEADLRLRGPGELLGTRQSGGLGLRLAELVRDEPLIPPVQALGRAIAGADPIAQTLSTRWLENRIEASV